MNDWVVETPSFEEDLMNDRVVMLNQVGVNKVVEIIKEKDKKIKELTILIKQIEAVFEKGRFEDGCDCAIIEGLLKDSDKE